jgi:hypothetical protein
MSRAARTESITTLGSITNAETKKSGDDSDGSNPRHAHKLEHT